MLLAEKKKFPHPEREGGRGVHQPKALESRVKAEAESISAQSFAAVSERASVSRLRIDSGRKRVRATKCIIKM